ncbi:hypothetical protein [Chryseobacterium viscerum]|uniref:C1q domain-containing protein n=1 Tax=Chryseobacterium viscerum TaxID=1037377 RepID=A0A5N4BSF6_9FLAO|nr:hypothetical protein [Chryseobacterium viscerum]KAB1231369.1 hypothetical protein F8D52_06055 [Chryseobacterium viscerum]
MKKKHITLIAVLFYTSIFSQVGINTATPQKTLHVNGSLQITNELNLGGNATTAGQPGTIGQYLVSNGAGAAPSWQTFADIVPSSNGSVIAVNGQLLVAQEITVQLSADFTAPSPAAVPIGNLNVKIIDNENTYTGTSATNSFTVKATGVYQVIMNMQIANTNSGNPVIGIWDDTLGAWVARVNDRIQTPTATDTVLQTFTLITSISMDSTHTYSFRVANNGTSTVVKALSSGSTGSGPVSQATVKRLR